MITEKTTSGISVIVRPFYLRKHSFPEQKLYVWAYEIKILNLSDTPAKLLNRHWLITNAQGEVEEVWGKGVVGVQPRILPGEHYLYQSFTRLSTPSGCMGGTYEMVRDDGLRFIVEIPVFRLKYPVELVQDAIQPPPHMT